MPSNNSVDCNDLLSKYRDNFKLIIKADKNNGQCLELEMINAPGIFHNTLRRLILAEVPSVSIDRIYLWNNTSVIEDSDLQLRLGLIPIDVDPDMLQVYDEDMPETDEGHDAFKSNSCFLFDLTVKHNKRDYLHAQELKQIVSQFSGGKVPTYIEKFNERIDMSVYSDDLKWIPLGDQKENFTDIKAVGGILLNRLMPREEINMRCLAVKGYGHDHAKFNPVSAANPRMAHKLVLKDNITGQDAETLMSLFPKGVLKIKHHKAVVINSLLIERAHRNFDEIPGLKGKVELSFDESHYLWKIESVRPKHQPAHKILSAGFQAMMDKCNFYIENIEKLNEAIKEEKTAVIDPKVFAKKHLGKMCHIEIVKTQGNPKFPMYHFIGETATLGSSLSYIITELFGEQVLSAYTEIHGGIELTLEIVGRKTKIDTTEILSIGLKSLSQYFSHMKQCFESEYAKFRSTDVDME